MMSTATATATATVHATPHLSRRAVAETARVYLLEEPALTFEDVMTMRGWDRRHRRYRRARRP